MRSSDRREDAADLGQFAVYRSRPFIVIVSAGRSGSTLLQGVVNAFPSYLIRGENFGFVHGLYRANHALQRAKLFVADDAPELAWFGARDLDDDLFRADVAPIIARQLLGSRCDCSFRAIGFKEIRWTNMEIGDTSLADYLHFIEAVFPLAKFLLLTRDIDEIMASAWGPLRDVPATRSHIQFLYLATRAAGLKDLFEIDYAELIENGDKIRELCGFLGEQYQPQIAEVLKIRHGR